MASNISNKTVFDPYSTYVTRIYRTIPKNCSLIIRNKFNGERVRVKKGGFALIAPWCESKLVSLAIRNIDYPEEHFDDARGQQIVVDIALSVRVVDPIKYEYAHQNIEQELKILIQTMIRVLMRMATWDELSRKHFELPKNDIRQDARFKYAGGKYYYRDSIEMSGNGKLRGNVISEFDLELFKIRHALKDFADQYGLEVVTLRNKEVQQSKEMQEIYDKSTKAKLEGEAAIEAAELEAKRAEIEARTIETREKARNIKYLSLLEELRKRGYSEQRAIQLAQTLMVSSGESKDVANATASTIAGVSAGVAATKLSEQEKQKKL